MNYIYSESFAPIFFAEYKRNKGEEVAIITINNNVKKYCDLVGINCIYTKRVSLYIYSFYKIFIFKSNIHKIITEIKIKNDDKFYLLDDFCALGGFYFSRLLRNKNVVYYYKTNEYQEEYKNYKSLRGWYARVNNIFYKLFLGLDLVLVKQNRTPDIGIDKKFFFKKNNIIISEEQKSFHEIQLDVIKSKTFNINKYETMFVDQGSADMFFKGGWLQNILKVFPRSRNKIIIKEHPQFKNANLFDGFEKFPVYIPSELLLANITKNVISIFSTTLITASKIEGLNAISILELIEWKDESFKKEQKDYLKKESDNRIFFVQTIEELIRFL